MKNEIVLSEETLLNYDFKIDARGYRPQEVDKLLDIVINDYKSWGRKEREYLEKIDEQKNEILELKHKLRTANESMQLYKSSEKEVTNVDILRRVSQLEKIIYGNSKNE